MSDAKVCKFQVNDKVVAVTAPSDFGILVIGKAYDVVSVGTGMVGLDDGFTYYDTYFELFKEKQMKLKDIIKPFMRVRTRSEGMWIAVEKDGEMFLVSNRHSYNRVEETGEYGVNCEGYDIAEVYAAPYLTCNLLDFNGRGALVWELEKPKSSQQLAQEAAVAELEASIKTSQDKLAALKLSLSNNCKGE